MNNPFQSDFPFYHPSSTLLLDDDEDFVEAVRAVLGHQQAVLGYSAVEPALACVRNSVRIAQGAFDLFAGHTYPAESGEAESGDQFVLVKSSRLHEFAASTARYRIISVVVVDEVMPGMRGLDFCRAIKDTGIKTILLTGRMEDAAATIAAFNSGVMDRFVSKKDPEALNKLKGMIEELHREYFAEQLAPYRRVLTSLQQNQPERLTDLMNDVYAEFPFTEYYYHARSGGYLLRNASGECRVCLFADATSLRELADFVEDQAGPSPISAALRSGEMVAWDLFDASYEGLPFKVRLEALLFPAHKGPGISWSLVPEAAMPYREKLGTGSWLDYKQQLTRYPLNWAANPA